MKGNFLAIGLGMLLLATAAKGPLDVHAKPRFQIVRFNIKRALPLNERVVVTFTPTKRGTFSFVCGMNMMRGELIVQ